MEGRIPQKIQDELRRFIGDEDSKHLMKSLEKYQIRDIKIESGKINFVADGLDPASVNNKLAILEGALRRGSTTQRAFITSEKEGRIYIDLNASFDLRGGMGMSYIDASGKMKVKPSFFKPVPAVTETTLNPSQLRTVTDAINALKLELSGSLAVDHREKKLKGLAVLKDLLELTKKSSLHEAMSAIKTDHSKILAEKDDPTVRLLETLPGMAHRTSPER